MRTIKQPGPEHSKRVLFAPAVVRAVEVELPVGVTLLQGLADAVRAHGADSAVFSVREGSFEPMAYFLPVLSKSPQHVAYFSDRCVASGAARMHSGSITYGHRQGEPRMHCHAAWFESDGQLHSGHLIGTESHVEHSVRLQAWMLHGAGFEVRPDEETNFDLLQVSSGTNLPGGKNALVVQVRPNQDLCLALEELCAERNIQHGTIRGGVGSLIGAAFDDGRTVTPFVTEVFITHGMIKRGSDGAPRAEVDVRLVDNTGQIADGRLARGDNPVLITFELVIEIEDNATWTEGQS